jgi:hypothetical protein
VLRANRASRHCPPVNGDRTCARFRIPLAGLALLAMLVTGVSACSPSGVAPASPTGPSPSATRPAAATQSAAKVTKVLTIVEENHSLKQMSSGMPYLYGLARHYAYSNNYTAISHPSLPNYLAIAGGDTFGVKDDAKPSVHVIRGQSIFGQAMAVHKKAGTYAESMPGNCLPTGNSPKGYAVRHNPWVYFASERSACKAHDNSASGFARAAKTSSLPNVAMLIPNTCHDAHDCSLGTADRWLRVWLAPVLASKDFTSGKLAVVVTADEDDHKSQNRVLTVVLHRSLAGSHKVVTTPLTHYSLSRFYSQVIGVAPLRRAAAARNLAKAFGLRVN